MTSYYKLIFTTLLIFLQYEVAISQNTNYLWHRIYSECTSGSVASQVVTANNDLYILSTHSGPMDVDPSIYDSMPQTGMTLIKYDDQRRYLWHQHIANVSGSMALKLDNQEHVFVYGISNSYDGDPGVGVTTITGGGSVIKFGPDGQFFWAKQLHTNQNYSFPGMAVDFNGNLYFTGVGGNFDADPSAATNMLGTMLSGSGAFMVKWDNDGNFKAAFPLSNTTSSTSGYDVEVFENKLFLSGRAYGEIDLDPSSTGVYIGGETAKSCGFIACYDTLFNFINGITIYNNGQSFKTSISAAGLTVGGTYNQTFDADPSAGVANLVTALFTPMPYFIRYNLNLAYQWGAYLQSAQSSGNIDIQDIAQKSNGEFFILGTYNRELDVDPGAGIFLLSNVSANISNLYVAHYSNSGTLIEANALTNQYAKTAGEISCSDKNRFFVGGGYRGIIDLNPVVNNEENALNGVNKKPFLLEMSTLVPEYVTLDDTICAGEIYTFGDREYTESGVYLHRFERTDGSDSIVSLHLLVKKIDIRVSTSGSYLFPHEVNATSYSLLNCATGQMIGAVQNDSIQPPSNDPVSLIITKSGCTDTTGCLQISMAANSGAPLLDWGYNLSKLELGNRASMTTDKYNNVYVAGYFTGLSNVKLFGGKLFVNETPSSSDMIVSKYNSEGVLQWSYTMGMDGTSSIFEQAGCIKVDEEGNVFIGGSYENTVDMNADEMYYSDMADLSPSNCCSYHAFLLKLNEYGQLVWHKSFGNLGGTTVNINDIDFDKDGNVGIIGNSTYQPIDLDPNAGVFLSPSKGTFFGKYTTDGNFIYGHSISSDNGNQNKNTAIRFDSGNNMVITGRSNLNADYDPSGGTFMLNGGSTSSYGYTFLAKYDPSFTLKWARIFGKTNHQSQPFADMEIDKNDNILLMTGLEGSNSFPNASGGTALSVNFYASYLVRFTPLGGFSQLYSYRGQSNTPIAFDLDNNDNIYLTGNLSPNGTASLGSYSLPMPTGGTYMAKYKLAGNLDFYFSISDETNVNSYAPVSIGCDEAGGFYLASHGSGTNSFDIDPSIDNFMMESSHSYLAKYGMNCKPFTASITINNNTLTAMPANSFYEWYRTSDNVLMQSGWDNTFASCGSGQFYAMVRQGNCYAQSNSLSLTSIPQTIVLNVTNDTICSNVWDFDVSLEGICPDSYSWYVNDVLVETTPSATMTSLENGDLVYCVIEDLSGVTFYTDTVEVAVAPQSATLNVVHDTICNGAWDFDVSLEGICPDSYSWYVNDVLVETTAAATIATLEDGDLVYCVIEDLSGATFYTDTIEVTVAPQSATLNVVHDTICNGAWDFDVSLEGICPDSYSWYVNDVLVETTAAATMTSLEDGDLVYCVIEDLSGATFYTDTVEVAVAPQSATLNVAHDSICNGAWDFDVSLEGICPDSYSWYVNDVLVETTPLATMTSLEDGDLIYCAIVDLSGVMFYTDTIEVTVAPQSATLDVVNHNICSNVWDFDVSLEGICPDSYSWYINDMLVETTAAATMTSLEDGDLVYCAIEDISGVMFYTDTIEVTVAPQSATLDVVNHNICSNVWDFDVSLEGICPDSYSWYINDMLVETTAAATMTSLEDGDLLYCAIEDISGVTFYTDTLEVNVYTISPLTVTVMQDGLSATSGFVSYQWLNCNTGSSPISGQNQLYFEPALAGDYAVVVSDANGCVDTSDCVNYDPTSALAEIDMYDLSVYPNPAKDWLMIKSTSNITGIQAYSMDGKAVNIPIKGKSSEHIELNISSLSSGIYILVIGFQSDSQQIRFFKQ